MGDKAPRRLSEIAAIAAQYGSHLRVKKGTRHPFGFEKAGKGRYPVKAHNAERSLIPWAYIRGLCRAHDIPESAFTDK
jgi:hypothetical protein